MTPNEKLNIEKIMCKYSKNLTVTTINQCNSKNHLNSSDVEQKQ